MIRAAFNSADLASFGVRRSGFVLAHRLEEFDSSPVVPAGERTTASQKHSACICSYQRMSSTQAAARLTLAGTGREAPLGHVGGGEVAGSVCQQAGGRGGSKDGWKET